MDRLREYARPTRPENWAGAGRDQADIDRWTEWCSENSNQGTRAKDGPIELPNTGKVKTRPTEMSPRTSRKVDAAMRGDGDLNNVGSSYLRGVRREA
jgi:hypothetical protein